MGNRQAFEELIRTQNNINMILSSLSEAEYRYASIFNRGPLIGVNLVDLRSYIQELKCDLAEYVSEFNAILKALNLSKYDFPSDLKELKSGVNVLNKLS